MIRFWYILAPVWGLEGMNPGMQIMQKACPSFAMHPQGKWNRPAHIKRSMGRPSHHSVYAAQTYILPNTWVFAILTGLTEAWKGWIQACRSCKKLVQPLPYIHKANGTGQHTSTDPWVELHIMMYLLLTLTFCQTHEFLLHSQAWLRPWEEGSRHADHAKSLYIPCHTSIRQMEQASTHQ